MKIVKIYHFLTLLKDQPAHEHVEYDVIEPIYVLECLDSNTYSIFSWSSSLLLAQFLLTIKDQIQGKRILELGAGTAFPSVVCAKLGAIKVWSSDRSEEKELLDNISHIAKLNGISNVMEAYPLDWGVICELDADIIIGADVLYSSEDFDSVLFTVFSVLARNPSAIFYTAYQNRNSFRCIAPSLQRYALRAEVISKDFVHSLHQQGECTLLVDEEEKVRKLESYDDILLLKIFSAE